MQSLAAASLLGTLLAAFYEEYWFMGLMAAILIGLVVLFIYLRKQGREED